MADHAPLLATPAGRSGLTIAIATVGAIVFVAHHPVASGGGGGGDVLHAMDALGGLDRVVHGGLIALMLAFALGFGGFVDHGGIVSEAMRAGLWLYRVGCVVAVGAALLDGFVIPDIAHHFLAAPADEQKMAFDLIVLAGYSIQVASKLALILMGGGLVTWGAVLLRRAGTRWLGAIGVIAGGAPALVLLATGLILRPASLLGVLGAQAVWNMGVAIWLMRGMGRGGAAASQPG